MMGEALKQYKNMSRINKYNSELIHNYRNLWTIIWNAIAVLCDSIYHVLWVCHYMKGSVIICCGFVIICCGSVIICCGFVIICCGFVIICCVATTIEITTTIEIIVSIVVENAFQTKHHIATTIEITTHFNSG